MKISNLKLGTKLYLGFGTLILFVLILSIANLVQTRTVSALITEQTALRTQKLEPLYVIREALDQTGIAARNAFVFPDDKDATVELDLVDKEKATYLAALQQVAPLFADDPGCSRRPKTDPVAEVVPTQN